MRIAAATSVLIMLCAAPVSADEMTACEAILEFVAVQAAPSEVQHDGDLFDCTEVDDGTWTCQLHVVQECPIPEDGAMSKPDFVDAADRMKELAADVQQCLGDWMSTPFEERSAIIDVYTQLTKGTRFQSSASLGDYSVEVASVARLDWVTEPSCASFSGLLSADNKSE